MLRSAGFICLRVAYREAFWEELSRLIRRGVRYGGHCCFQYMYRICNIFHNLPSRVGSSFQGKLFSIFKLLCLGFVRYYLSSRTALENCVLLVIALRSSWEHFFADTRFVLLTQTINAPINIFDLTFLPGGRHFDSNFCENAKIPPYAPPPPLLHSTLHKIGEFYLSDHGRQPQFGQNAILGNFGL